MYKLNKVDIEKLKPLESYFIQIRENYKRCSSVKEDMIVAEIYERITGKKETNFACGQCSFRMYKVVGDAYWQALDALKSEATDTTTSKKNNTTTKKTNTNGRKRTGVKAKKDSWWKTP